MSRKSHQIVRIRGRKYVREPGGDYFTMDRGKAMFVPHVFDGHGPNLRNKEPLCFEGWSDVPGFWKAIGQLLDPNVEGRDIDVCPTCGRTK